MKKIVILSGKGGVGKSSITANLAYALSKTDKVICADCDVDASNLALVLGKDSLEKLEDLTTNEIAEFNMEKCKRCKKCFDNCNFNAISWEGKPALKPFSCEGCGVCEIVCEFDAVRLKPVKNASIGWSNTEYGFKVVTAQLKMGESGSGKVVAEVKKMAETFSEDIMLIDSAAGIGCPVIASLTGANYAIGIAEPTPAGFTDLKRALKIVEHFKIPYSIIINKWDINPNQTAKIEEYAKTHKIKILGKIPYDKLFVESLVKRKLIYNEKLKNLFCQITESLRGEIS